jgi:hypothetical protein
MYVFKKTFGSARAKSLVFITQERPRARSTIIRLMNSYSCELVNTCPKTYEFGFPDLQQEAACNH